MGTRSVVALPDAEHGWKGRYVHWDGYPTGVGEVLRRLVVRESRTVAVETLVYRHYGWSSLNERQGPEALGAGYTDGRFARVLGYGIAYTTKDGQSSPEEWVDPDGDDWGTEWAYVLEPTGIRVLERLGDRWARRGFVSYDDTTGMAELEASRQSA